MTRTFAVTFDYRCPYARIAHDHLHAGLSDGADWDVTFLPYCLGQSHVEDGMTDVWDRPDTDSGLLALQLAVSVRDMQPTAFLDTHHGLFRHRHVGGGSLRDRDALSRVLADAGADPDAAFADVASGRTLGVVREEHHRYVDSHGVWGVPTFIAGSAAVFVRLLDRADGDGRLARDTVERILDNMEWAILNEFKHTTVPR
jgi:2-hydroxychromene-2-carboxylate isomerase